MTTSLIVTRNDLTGRADLKFYGTLKIRYHEIRRLRIGAEFDPDKERILQRPRISLELGGRGIRADIHSEGIAGVQDDETWVRAMLLDWQPFTFELYRRTIWAAVGRLIGSKSPPIGGTSHVGTLTARF